MAVVRFLSIVALSVISLAACGAEDETQLFVDIRTDLLPGREFTSVQTLVWTGDMARDLGNVTLAADPSVDYGAGARAAELSGLPAGPILLRVTLLDTRGDAVLSRRVRLDLEGRRGVTVVFTRSCVAVECPATGDDPGQTECLGGRCVAPECTGAEAECGAGTCRSNADCDAAVGCAIPLCVDGACLSVPDDSICGTETYCHPSRGCMPDDSPTDAGPRADAGPRTDAGPPVDAGGPGCPGGCDDGEPCTDDACEDGACVYVHNTAPCDDGVFCNGADSCAGGTCATHPGDPCSGASVCDETTDTCTGCLGDADCPADSFGAWTACGSFIDMCDTTGNRTRGVTSWACEGGMCVSTTSTEIGSCSRVTDGIMCESRTFGPWSACGSFADTCDESGSRSRTVSDYFCASGTCTATDSTENEACTRDTDGTACSLGFGNPCDVTRCSAGTCQYVGHTCGTGICCEFGCQPMGTLCP